MLSSTPLKLIKAVEERSFGQILNFVYALGIQLCLTTLLNHFSSVYS